MGTMALQSDTSHYKGVGVPTPKLTRVRFLRNNGITVVHTSTRGVRVRFARPGSAVSIPEAAKALGTYPEMLRRMVRAGRLGTVRVNGRDRVPVTECLRLRRAWRGNQPTTLTEA